MPGHEDSRLWGWIAGRWKKNPLQFGYSDTLGVGWLDTNLGAGNQSVSSATVPAGEIWVVTNIAFMCISGSITKIRVFVAPSGALYEAHDQDSPVSTTYYSLQGWWVLEEDGYITTRFYGCTAGDDGYGRLTGFKIDIDQG